jgi:hypothetical protein
MSKSNKVDKDEHEMLLISALKSCTEVMLESDMYIKSAKNSDFEIAKEVKEFHEKRKNVARAALRSWISDYLNNFY